MISEQLNSLLFNYMTMLIEQVSLSVGQLIISFMSLWDFLSHGVVTCQGQIQVACSGEAKQNIEKDREYYGSNKG